jgi:hypothetical protein
MEAEVQFVELRLAIRHQVAFRVREIGMEAEVQFAELRSYIQTSPTWRFPPRVLCSHHIHDAHTIRRQRRLPQKYLHNCNKVEVRQSSSDVF